MNAQAESMQRPIDRWFASYSGDHRNNANQWIHVFAVPAILWSVVALLWCIPVPITWFKAGLWAALAMFAAWMFYWRASRPVIASRAVHPPPIMPSTRCPMFRRGGQTR